MRAPLERAGFVVERATRAGFPSSTSIDSSFSCAAIASSTTLPEAQAHGRHGC
jgi:hypothetical protein